MKSIDRLLPRIGTMNRKGLSAFMPASGVRGLVSASQSADKSDKSGALQTLRNSKLVDWLGLCALLLLASCTTVTETGRKQLLLISPGQEMQLGLTSFEKMKKEVPVSNDPAAKALVERVGKRIAAVAPLPNAQWEFVVFDSKEANAFCLPGGKVGVYAGILPITQNEAGLATVLGHEVAHAAAHHGGERLSEALLLQTGGQVLGASLSASDPRVQAAATTAYGLGATLGRELPHSRKQESEADFIGLLYMARAGYNPEEAVRFWERFAEYNRSSGGGTPWFLRTHPLDDKRIQALKSELPRAMQEYRSGQR
jgi:predicted Zn-dependent protease